MILNLSRRSISCYVLPFLFAVCSVTSGCSEQKSFPVEGKVTFKGGGDAKELAGYGVTFESQEQKVSASGEVQADGTFKMSTFTEGDGAVPGKHKVAITPKPPELDKPSPKPLIDLRYADPAQSGIEVEVKKEKTNPITIEVERAR